MLTLKLKKKVQLFCQLLKYQGMFLLCSYHTVLIFKMNYVFTDLIQMLYIFKWNRISKNLLLVTEWRVLNLTYLSYKMREKVSSRRTYPVTGSLMNFYCQIRTGTILSHRTYKQTDFKTTLHAIVNHSNTF